MDDDKIFWSLILIAVSNPFLMIVLIFGVVTNVLRDWLYVLPLYPVACAVLAIILTAKKINTNV